MYSRKPTIVVAFHGCDLSVRNQIINQKSELKPSTNDYDWLGHGCYFWENDEPRALQFAQEAAQRNGNIKEPAVLGAYIDLGYCLDLMESKYLAMLKPAYTHLKDTIGNMEKKIPENRKDLSGDYLLRDRDCSIIEALHLLRIDDNQTPFDSVRGVFWEGEDLYPGAGMKEKNHIQICVRNINCIKAFFIPRTFTNKPFIV
jgi:hypothetical protein